MIGECRYCNDDAYSYFESTKKGNVVKKINLRVREDNEVAINLYRELGFKKEGVITRDFNVHGKYYSSIFMGLEIN